MKKIIPYLLAAILVLGACITWSGFGSIGEADADSSYEVIVCSKELMDVDASELKGIERMEKHGGCGSRL